MQRLTVAQIDFILEMEARDNPKEWEFTRPGQVDPKLRGVMTRTGLFNFFIGGAAQRFIGPQLNQAVLDLRRKTEGLKRQFGVRRMKKDPKTNA